MQDLKLLHSRGATPEKLKAKLTATKKDPQIKRLLELHEQRLIRYISRNFEDSKIYWTLDKIIDASLRNLKYVQAREILATQPTWEAEKIASTFYNWGLHTMLVPAKNPDGTPKTGTGGQPFFELDLPIFDTVYVPLVMAYRSIRWAKLFNERNTFPLYKYSPSHATTKHLAQTDVITSVIGRISQDMAYSQDLKQAILQMLDYGIALRVPESAWFREEYMAKDNGKEIVKTQREGIKFAIPRPERTFIDAVDPIHTLNSDTGCKFLGYWDLKRYGTLKNDKALWNTDKINYGSSQAFFRSTGWTVYQELYPCTLKIPICNADFDYATIDRQDKEFWYSTSSEEDAATIVTVMFDKIIPSEWNLFDYDYPVWTRWVYADTCTPLYMEVLPYTPGSAYLFDYDSNRGFQNSLTLQLSPFQQLFGNFLTQYFISIKNNLPRIIFYNTDVVDKEHIERITAQKHRLYQQVTFLPFSKREQSFQQQTQADAFFPVLFPQVNVSELSSTLRLTVELCERMLGYPSQEVGAPATHEQTAKEIIAVTGFSSTRSDFTADGVDQAEKAVKRMLYEAWANYGSDQVTAVVVGITPERKKALEALGFEVESGESNKTNTFGVTGKKSALLLSDFATDQTGTTRSQDTKVAIGMMQALGVALQNPVIFEALGVEQIVQLINDVFVWAGLPEDFRFKADPKKTAEAQRQQFVEALEKAKGEILQASMQQTQQQLLAVADSIKKQVIQPMEQVVQGVGQRFQAMAAEDQQRDAIIQKLVESLTLTGNGGGVPIPGPGGLGAVAPPVPVIPPEAAIPPELLAAAAAEAQAAQTAQTAQVPPELLAAADAAASQQGPPQVPPGVAFPL
jgi:hypothetical protein